MILFMKQSKDAIFNEINQQQPEEPTIEDLAAIQAAKNEPDCESKTLKEYIEDRKDS